MRNLEKLRLERGWTQQELGDRCDVSPSVISRIEKGHSKGSKLALAALARALEVPIEDSAMLRDEVLPAREGDLAGAAG